MIPLLVSIKTQSREAKESIRQVGIFCQQLCQSTYPHTTNSWFDMAF